MGESGLVLTILEYDPTLYDEIIKSGRLAPLDLGKKKCLSEEEANENSANSRGSLVFSNKYVFDTRDIGRILQVHMPLDSNAYYEDHRRNILNITFYTIPKPSK